MTLYTLGMNASSEMVLALHPWTVAKMVLLLRPVNFLSTQIFWFSSVPVSQPPEFPQQSWRQMSSSQCRQNSCCSNLILKLQSCPNCSLIKLVVVKWGNRLVESGVTHGIFFLEKTRIVLFTWHEIRFLAIQMGQKTDLGLRCEQGWATNRRGPPGAVEEDLLIE